MPNGLLCSCSSSTATTVQLLRLRSSVSVTVLLNAYYLAFTAFQYHSPPQFHSHLHSAPRCSNSCRVGCGSRGNHPLSCFAPLLSCPLVLPLIASRTGLDVACSAVLHVCRLSPVACSPMCPARARGRRHCHRVGEFLTGWRGLRRVAARRIGVGKQPHSTRSRCV